MVYEIFRPLDEHEKVDVQEIGQTNILDVFLAKLADKRQEYAKEYKPYDSYCARLDFEELVRKTAGDYRTVVDKKLANSKIDIPDLDIYGNSDRFVLIGSKDVYEDKLLDGIRQSVKTGKEYQYKGKLKGNGVSIFVPLDRVKEVEDRFKDNTAALAHASAKKEVR